MLKIVRDKISRSELQAMAEKMYGNLIKAVVDVDRDIMAIGGELHADEETVLLEDGSKQADLWGINLYPDKTGGDWIEFDSMVNLRPWQNNRSRGVEDPLIQEKIKGVVKKLIE